MRFDVFQKDYLLADKTRKLKSLWTEKAINYDRSKSDLKAIRMGKYFDYAKPLSLISKICLSATTSEDIILDFFAGSGTTAHAVMKLNSEDGGNRKFIMVQLDEECDPKSEAYKAGYKNIAELSRERIRRAGKKILEDSKDQLDLRETPLDIGFRAFKVDSNNFIDSYVHPSEQTKDNLTLDVVKEGRSDEDLLFQTMLAIGLELNLKIEKVKIGANKLFFVNENELVMCLEKDITTETLDEILKVKPLQIVFRDFLSDSEKINITTRVSNSSSVTEVKFL